MTFSARSQAALLLFAFATPCSLAAPQNQSEPWMPVVIGAPQWSLSGARTVLSNEAISVSWTPTDRQVLRIANKLSPSVETIDFAPFQLVFRDGHTVSAASMTRVKRAFQGVLRASGSSPKQSDRFRGLSYVTDVVDPGSGVEAVVTVSMRAGDSYVRETVELTPRKEDADIAKVVLLDASVPGAKVTGTAQGSPAAAGNWFFGLEHPLSHSEVDGDHLTCSIARKLPLKAEQTTVYSAVVGVTPQGQLRRGFLRYVERERAHPYRPYLHYNCWYDLGMDKLYDQAECIDRINRFGVELYKKRHVKLSSYLFDDGWDDTSTTWKFNSGFPDGFRPLAKAAAAYNAAPGIWLSPWGGYSERRDQRLAAGKKNGYEEDSEGLALSGPKYYERFRDVCLDLLKQGVNQFKFDGTGSPDKQYPGSAFGSDFEAAIALIGDLRKAKPDLFVNLTTNTWPSPFWTRYADSIWRGGYDHSFAGVGTKRQQWMTYRDGDTYRRVVVRGPLYPLNSLMLHGLIYAKFAENLGDDPGNDFASDVHAYFGTGTQLQEMYITPTLLTVQNWDDLAEGALWARANADVLKDTHWVGGDPIKLEVYGHAGWNGSKGYLELRNPSDKPQEIAIEIGKTLELPAGHSGAFRGMSPWKVDAGQGATTFTRDEPQTIRLKPFQVVTFDLGPVGN